MKPKLSPQKQIIWLKFVTDARMHPSTQKKLFPNNDSVGGNDDHANMGSAPNIATLVWNIATFTEKV